MNIISLFSHDVCPKFVRSLSKSGLNWSGTTGHGANSLSRPIVKQADFCSKVGWRSVVVKPQPVTSTMMWNVPGGNYRGQGVWVSGILDTLDVRIQQAIAEQWPYGDFLERLLEDEVERRGQKQPHLRRRCTSKRSMLASGAPRGRLPAFPPPIDIHDVNRASIVQQHEAVLKQLHVASIAPLTVERLAQLTPHI